MEKYDNEALWELCSRIDLLEYASKTMDFEKRGSGSYVTHCPLHVDRTPSLFITPELNQFYCQSCHVGGGILQWLMTFEELRFPEAVKKLTEIAGVNIDSLKTSETMAFFKQLKMATMKKPMLTVHREILPDSYMNQFDSVAPQEWLDEGISAEVMKEFGVCIDNKSNRIVYPVYDADFNLIGAKGRTRFAAYKDLHIRKYQNYQKIGTTDYFAGMKENYEIIQEQQSAIIFEGIKSVMKLYGWGWKNVIAAETSILNESQIIILIKMGIKEVTFALDNDVSLKKIKENTKKLRRYMKVYAVIDRKNLLQGKKMAPCDAGLEIWRQLYEERIKL